MEKEKQDLIWNQIASTWNKYKKEQFGDKTGILKRFITKKDSKVLDLGCGSGRNFFKFKGTIYGIDFSDEMLKFAKENAEKLGITVVLKKSQACKLDFPRNYFDKALFIATLHCIDTKLKRKKAVKELFRVLKPGGRAIITVWNKDSKRWRAKSKEKLVSWDVGKEKVWRYYYLFSPDELKELVESVGFKVVKESFPKARNIVFLLEKVKK